MTSPVYILTVYFFILGDGSRHEIHGVGETFHGAELECTPVKGSSEPLNLYKFYAILS